LPAFKDSEVPNARQKFDPAATRQERSARDADSGVRQFNVAQYGASKFARALIIPLLAEHGIPVTVINRSGNDALRVEQDFEYDVIERGTTGDPVKTRITNVENYLVWGEKNFTEARQAAGISAVIDALGNRDLDLITVTVTERAYFLDSKKCLDLNRQEVIDCVNGDLPTTPVGQIMRALEQRFQAELADPSRIESDPLVVLALDNMDGNGRILKEAVIAYAGETEAASHDFLNWLDTRVLFPNAAADRIVQESGNADRPYVVTEPLGMYPLVIEGHGDVAVLNSLSGGHVKLVGDVTPYRDAKRLLVNATHLALGLLGGLAGYRTVSGAMTNRIMYAHVRSFQEQVIPLLAEHLNNIDDAPTVEELKAYASEALTRFQNPNLLDKLVRIRRNSFTKMGDLILPELIRLIDKDLESNSVSLVVGSWIRALHASQATMPQKKLLKDQDVPCDEIMDEPTLFVLNDELAIDAQYASWETSKYVDFAWLARKLAPGKGSPKQFRTERRFIKLEKALRNAAQRELSAHPGRDVSKLRNAPDLETFLEASTQRVDNALLVAWQVDCKKIPDPFGIGRVDDSSVIDLNGLARNASTNADSAHK
jgi:mannitol-1-phosphate/altronate dehydrogenase